MIKHNLLFHWGHPLDFISRIKMHEAKLIQIQDIYRPSHLDYTYDAKYELEIGVVVEDLLLERQPAEFIGSIALQTLQHTSVPI